MASVPNQVVTVWYLLLFGYQDDYTFAQQQDKPFTNGETL